MAYNSRKENRERMDMEVERNEGSRESEGGAQEKLGFGFHN